MRAVLQDRGKVRQVRRRRPEQGIQKALVDHLGARAAAGTYWFHPANGGARTAIEGAILKGLGVVPGAPDPLLWHDGLSYALEIKSEAGRITEAQLDMLNRLSEAGVYTAICHGLDRAIGVLESWRLLKGRCQ
jgi:hypothetical protein